MSANAQHKSFSITGALGAGLLVAFTANRGEVAPATAGTQKLAGPIDLASKAAGDMVDIPMWGMSKVKLGGTVAAGDKLTADANSKAVVAAAVEDATVYVVGEALEPGVTNDVIWYRVAPSVIVGPPSA
jgi:hypothetical protein